MLQKLSITNYTLIRSVDIDFGRGFTAITGETGAGKSILLGALSLILGQRADPSVLMDKSKKCVVEGTFDISGLHLESFFESHDLDYDEQTLLRREINPAGKSRAFINDTPVNLSLLRSLGDRLTDIHSQHQTLWLNETEFQTRLFDAFVNNAEVQENYQQLYRDFKNSEKKLSRLQEQNEQLKRDEDYFRFQLNELDAAGLDPEEMNALEEKNRLFSHAVEIKTATDMAVNLLKENEFSVLEQLGQLKEAFSKLTEFHPDISEFYERLQSSYIELADLASGIENFASLNEFDPAELQQVEERLNTLYSLQQKHHVSDISGLLALREEYRRKLENISGVENELQEEKERFRRLAELLEAAARSWHAVRQEKVAQFEKEVVALLQQLGMKEAQFKVELTPTKDFTPLGKEKLTFFFTANRGGTLLPIAKTASGGELSRLMLALKSLVHRAGMLPTIIFDEIDAGVSGDIAGKLGAILKKMAENVQVMAITHLPQIASRADHHFKVFKRTESGMTLSEIVALQPEERLEEIAKMLSDEKITDASRAAAAELLKGMN
jgi:DNA repair protein RecN (Recombination protein N)